MRQTPSVDEDLRRQMEDTGIDVELTVSILERINEGRFQPDPVKVAEIPSIDNETILDLTGDLTWSASVSEVRQALDSRGLPQDLVDGVPTEDGRMRFTRDSLERIGRRLLPAVAYGILNGGSATSYVDRTKNRSFHEDLFELYRPEFEGLQRAIGDAPKGVTPALVQPNGEYGPSFIELKMRSLLVQTLRARRHIPETEDALYPMFQMTSVGNDAQISKTYDEYRNSAALKDLIEATGIDITRTATRVQPMIAAFTHGDEGRPRRIFRKPGNEGAQVLPLPGGHGQCFAVLKDVFRDLEEQGKRFVQLGNVDNTGNTVSPTEVALLALSGREAGFDFAFRTPVDVKGGILVRDENGRLNAADIGPAIAEEEVFEAEKRGNRILFNCATGLFDLRYLNRNIDRIIETIPLRVSDQRKDAGAYSQAEQITWEVISVIDKPLIFGVDKYERFLAAKLLVEMLMTSGLKLEDPTFPTGNTPADDLRTVARSLHNGLLSRLRSVYAMEGNDSRWSFVPAAQLM